MYENITADTIHADMLDSIDSSYEKTKGFPTYDITRSFALETEGLYEGIQTLMNKLDTDKLTGDELTKYVFQRKGIKRKSANAAKGAVTVIGNGQINVGDIFETKNGVQFKATTNVTVTNNADIAIVAVATGTIGNVGSNTIVQMPITIAGITACNNSAATYDGYEAESDDALRERYYEAIQIPATSGNKYHYIKWAKEVVGVGDAKVYSLWNGPNTVKILIIDSNKQIANADLIKRVQDYIDPKGDFINNQWTTWGTGAGEAPLGAYCTIDTATAKIINVTVDISLKPNYTIDIVKSNITANLTQYFQTIAFQSSLISYAKIGTLIFETEGVADYTTLLLNNGTTGVTLADNEIPAIGVVNVV